MRIRKSELELLLCKFFSKVEQVENSQKINNIK